MRRFFFFSLALLFPDLIVSIHFARSVHIIQRLCSSLVLSFHGRLRTLIPGTEIHANNNRKCIQVTLFSRTNFHFQSSRVDRTLIASGCGTSRTWKRAFGNVKILNIIMHTKVSNYLRIGFESKPIDLN